MIAPADIAEAIRTHGARRVYAVANAAFTNRAELHAIGLQAENMGDVNAIQSAAFKELGPADKAIDLAQTTAAMQRKV